MSAAKQKRTAYGSDSSSNECERIRFYIPQPKQGGEPMRWNRNKPLNAVHVETKWGTYSFGLTKFPILCAPRGDVQLLSKVEQ